MIGKDCYYVHVINERTKVNTMNVSLTPTLESYVKQKVAAGMYNSVSEIVREALRLLEERDAMQAMKLEALRTDIKQGVESLDKGEGKPLDAESIKARGRELLQANRDR
jgi:antitoxin ParD1/3/4